MKNSNLNSILDQTYRKKNSKMLWRHFGKALLTTKIIETNFKTIFTIIICSAESEGSKWCNFLAGGEWSVYNSPEERCVSFPKVQTMKAFPYQGSYQFSTCWQGHFDTFSMSLIQIEFIITWCSTRNRFRILRHQLDITWCNTPSSVGYKFLESFEIYSLNVWLHSPGYC